MADSMAKCQLINKRNDGFRLRHCHWLDTVILPSNTVQMTASHLTQKGQITVPKAARDAMGWTQQTPLTFIQEADGVKIVEVSRSPSVILEQMKAVHWHGPTADEIRELTRSEI